MDGNTVFVVAILTISAIYFVGSSPGGGKEVRAPRCPANSSDITYLPVDGDCSQYWECVDGNSYLHSCPSGLWWNPEYDFCDLPGDYCYNTLNFTCPYPGNKPTFYPYPGDCTKFVQCYRGSKYVWDCFGNLWWNEAKESCDEPGDYCTPNSDVM